MPLGTVMAEAALLKCTSTPPWVSVQGPVPWCVPVPVSASALLALYFFESSNMANLTSSMSMPIMRTLRRSGLSILSNVMLARLRAKNYHSYARRLFGLRNKKPTEHFAPWALFKDRKRYPLVRRWPAPESRLLLRARIRIRPAL